MKDNQETCSRCGVSSDYSGDWFVGLCPKCADQTEVPSAIRQFRLVVPTYFGNVDEPIGKEEFDDPHVPVLIHEAGGVRIVLGTHDYNDLEKPDVQIERRPNGWAIFLHPVGGGDPSGYIYFLDDGRSYLLPETPFGCTPPIETVRELKEVREVDLPLGDTKAVIDETALDLPQHVAVQLSPGRRNWTGSVRD